MQIIIGVCLGDLSERREARNPLIMCFAIAQSDREADESTSHFTVNANEILNP